MTQNDLEAIEPLLSPEEPGPEPGRKQRQQPKLALLLFSAVAIFAFFAVRRSLNCRSSTPHAGIHFASPIQQFWGAYTPYFPAKPYVPPPSHCQITQVRFVLVFNVSHH